MSFQPFTPTTKMRVAKLQFYALADKPTIEQLLAFDPETELSPIPHVLKLFGSVTGATKASHTWKDWFGVSNVCPSGRVAYEKLYDPLEALAWFRTPENPGLMMDALRGKALSYLDSLLDQEHIDADTGELDVKVATLKMKAAECLLKQDPSVVNNNLTIKYKFGKHSVEDLNNQLQQLTMLTVDA